VKHLTLPGRKFSAPSRQRESDAVSPRNDLALEFESVDAGYGRVPVLKQVTFALRKGTVAALLGPNGAGKTTLLRVASGLLRPERGSVRMFGVDATELPTYRRASNGLTLVPEGRGIFRNMTVADNLYLGINWHQRSAAVAQVADAFPELSKHLKRSAGTLSGGQQQMLALARCYLAKPEVVLFDEISMGLAPIVIDSIYGHIRKLAEDGTTILLVEQYVQRALELADEAHILVSGTLVYSGPAADLSHAQVLAGYLGGNEASNGL
jgi:branched-chain amino acid transport system ATP-binding protein